MAYLDSGGTLNRFSQPLSRYWLYDDGPFVSEDVSPSCPHRRSWCRLDQKRCRHHVPMSRCPRCVCPQQDLAAISSQVDSITRVAEQLLKLYPDAHEHIGSKHEQMVQLWNLLLSKAEQRKQKLSIAENLQTYFNDYRQLTYVSAHGRARARGHVGDVVVSVSHGHRSRRGCPLSLAPSGSRRGCPHLSLTRSRSRRGCPHLSLARSRRGYCSGKM